MNGVSKYYYYISKYYLYMLAIKYYSYIYLSINQSSKSFGFSLFLSHIIFELDIKNFFLVNSYYIQILTDLTYISYLSLKL